ncbi:MAG: zf-TFIIB domain-containing protein [Sphingomicrobium sp.]
MRNENEVAAMACPVCRSPLALAERQGVEIDYCPTCRGVWLDRGEIDKIVERSVIEPVRAAAPPPRGHGDTWRPDRDDDRHRYPKRKKSFLTELFD